MNRGKLIALDTPVRLRNADTEPLFELKTDDSPRAVKLLQRMDGVREAAMYGRAVHVAVTDAEHARREIPARLAAEGIALQGMERITPSLEDVFVFQVRAAGGAPVD
jgi:ABC-2 type transport system ATP-binding protein